MKVSRRAFIKRAAISGASAAFIMSGAAGSAAAANSEEYATLIDLTLCDGCPGREVPACVEACRIKNEDNFPQPEKPIMDYWPQETHEDWSDKKHLTDRLTPYNWTYVQKLEVTHNGRKVKVNVPRRCMHCDNPPCSALCPFGVNEKLPEGPVVIDTGGCFGGAKCRDVCPWHIPQRQAGVGLYKEVAPKYAGGGVMYKCDLCVDLIENGGQPACVTACPRGAQKFAARKEIEDYARRWVEENQGYIYGDTQNGGTSTLYLSSIPFTAINKAIAEQEIDGKPGRPAMPTEIDNPLNEASGMAQSFLLAPVAGVAAAGLSVYRIMKGEENHEDIEA